MNSKFVRPPQSQNGFGFGGGKGMGKDWWGMPMQQNNFTPSNRPPPCKFFESELGDFRTEVQDDRETGERIKISADESCEVVGSVFSKRGLTNALRYQRALLVPMKSGECLEESIVRCDVLAEEVINVDISDSLFKLQIAGFKMVNEVLGIKKNGLDAYLHKCSRAHGKGNNSRDSNSRDPGGCDGNTSRDPVRRTLYYDIAKAVPEPLARLRAELSSAFSTMAGQQQAPTGAAVRPPPRRREREREPDLDEHGFFNAPRGPCNPFAIPRVARPDLIAPPGEFSRAAAGSGVHEVRPPVVSEMRVDAAQTTTVGPPTVVTPPRVPARTSSTSGIPSSVPCASASPPRAPSAPPVTNPPSGNPAEKKAARVSG